MAEKAKPSEENKPQEEKMETKTEEAKAEKKPEKVIKAKKEEALAKGNNLHISMKEGRFICKFILGKTIDTAISDLQDVLKMKKVVPYTGEIPHRSEPGVMAGRYPQNATKAIISVLKGLRGNAIANSMDLDNAKISSASSSFASRPSKRGGGTFKRANIIIKAKEIKPQEAKK